MGFDSYEHRMRDVVLRIGRKLYPGMNNVSEIFERIEREFNVRLPSLNTRDVNHLPTPAETGPFYKCPKCGVASLSVFELCPGCKESEDGRLKYKLVCVRCDFVEFREERLGRILEGLGVEYSSGNKVDLGVRRITDKGVI